MATTNQNTKIEEIDQNFKSDKNVKGEQTYVWLDPKETDAVSVYGFNWFNEDHRYRRFPAYADNKIAALEGSLDILSSNTAGGMIAFWSNTSCLSIDVNLSHFYRMAHMPYTGQIGFDLYLGDSFETLKFFGVSHVNLPEYKMFYKYTFSESLDRNKKHLFVLNFPLYGSVSDLKIGISQDAEIEKADNLFPHLGKIVFYGTPITQGGCASRPGAGYTNIISRHLGYECLNFGFSGNGKGQIEVAQLLAALEDVKIYVLAYQGNVNFDDLKKTLEPLVRTIRKSHPDIPIILVSRIIFSEEEHFESKKQYAEEMRKYQENFVKTYGDHYLYYVDGKDLLGDDYLEKTVDGVHPNDYGFQSIAVNLEKIIKKYLS